MIPMQNRLHRAPKILNWGLVWGMSKPVNYPYSVLFELSLCDFGDMYFNIILLKKTPQECMNPIAQPLKLLYNSLQYSPCF